jgi:hypothetical protein
MAEACDALIREKRPTPTLFHMGPTHCTEDTMRPLTGRGQVGSARRALWIAYGSTGSMSERSPDSQCRALSRYPPDRA